MKRYLMFLVWICVINVGVQAAPAALMDDFSGDLSAYTSTVILDNSNPAVQNTAAWQISGGALQLNTTVVDGSSVEQYAMIHSGLVLLVGQELQMDIVHSGASQDIGLYVGGTTPTFNVRQDYVAMYYRNNGNVFSRGFDGTTEYALAGIWSNVTLEALFIARTGVNTYEAGYYASGVRNILVTRTPTTANDGDVVGFYADVRATGVLGNVDNLRILSLPYSPSVTQTAQSGYVEAVLNWDAAADPNSGTTGYAVHPDIVNQYVFVGSGSDPNLYYVGATGTDPGTADPASQLVINKAYDTTYSWAVVEAMGGHEQTFTSASKLTSVDANNIVGPTWTFASLSSTPAITTQPSSMNVFPTETATISAVFTSITTPTAVWKKYVDGTNDTTVSTGGKYTVSLTNTSGASYTATMMIANPTSAEEGQYYCNLTNTGVPGTTVKSDTVNFGVKRQLAHWTLNNDSAGWDGTYYLDSSGEGHSADPNGTPAFVADPNGDANKAVTIDTVNGYASAGTWNPSEFTSQFTVSLWAKWAGQGSTTTWQGLISKETSYGSAMMWQLEVTSAAQASSTVVLKNGLETNNLSSAILPVGTWEHVAVTFDGTTATIYRNGVAAVSGTWSMGTGTTAPVNIGISARSLTENLMFNGALDDVQIYNYALSDTDVADIYYAMIHKPVCINDYASGFDYDENCVVDLADFAAMAAQWLDCGLYPVAECP